MIAFRRIEDDSGRWPASRLSAATRNMLAAAKASCIGRLTRIISGSSVVYCASVSKPGSARAPLIEPAPMGKARSVSNLDKSRRGTDRWPDAIDHQAAEQRIDLRWCELRLSLEPPGQNGEESAHDALHDELPRNSAIVLKRYGELMSTIVKGSRMPAAAGRRHRLGQEASEKPQGRKPRAGRAGAVPRVGSMGI